MRWLLLVLLIPLVHADVSVLTVDLASDSYTYEYVGNNTIMLPAVIEDVSIMLNGYDADCNVSEQVGYTVVDCGEGTNSIITSFTTQYPLIEVGDQTVWRYSGANEVRVILPGNAEIVDTRLIIPVARMYELNGRIIVHWMQTADEYQLSYKTTSFPWQWALLLLPLLYFLRPRQSNHLLENEKKVVTALRIHGSLWTKELLLKTKLSKVKMSRLLKSMEKRGIIERQAYGNSHKIKLK